MRIPILVLLIVPLALAAADQKKTETRAPKQAAKKAQEAPPKQAQELTVPAGAKEVDAYTWRHTDAQGKNWIYRKTPFGLVKYEDKGGDKIGEDLPPGMTAVDQGDSIQFERPSPFGTYRWVRKKSEQLTDMEQKAWDREREKKSAQKNASQE